MSVRNVADMIIILPDSALLLKFFYLNGSNAPSTLREFGRDEELPIENSSLKQINCSKVRSLQ